MDNKIIIAVIVVIIFVAALIITWLAGGFDTKEKESAQPPATEPAQPPATEPAQPPATEPVEPPATEPVEPFTNDLPYQLNNVTVKYSSNEDTDYNELLQDMALDNDVKSQHKQYVTDRNKVTSTASFVPARSDTQDIVPRWGLSANTYIPIDSSAREIPSQDPEQGPKPVRLRWN